MAAAARPAPAVRPLLGAAQLGAVLLGAVLLAGCAARTVAPATPVTTPATTPVAGPRSTAGRAPEAASPAAPGARPRVASDADQRVDSLAEAWFDATLALNPVFAASVGDARYNDRFSAAFEPDVRARSAALADEYGRRLDGIDRGALDTQHALTFDLLRRVVDDDRRAARFPAHLLPLNQFANFTATFAQLGAGTGLHRFRTPRDYDDFLARISGFERTVDAAIAGMREGMARGVVQPRVLMERTLPQLAAHVVADSAQSVFWGPITNMPAGVPPAERARIAAAYGAAIRGRIVPAYRRLHDFVRDEYLPRTRATAGLGALPEGRAWYAERVRAMTTTDLAAEEIHETGLREVARLHREMEGVMRQVGWTGDLPSFLRHVQTDPKFRYATREEMLADYRAAQARIDASTDRLFDIRPAANYEIRPVEAYRERSAAPGSYMAASPDGSRPGIFYLNTYDPPGRPRSMKETLLVHEGSPGHHFQVSVARELTGVPRLAASAGSRRTPRGGGCTPRRWGGSSASTPTRTSTSGCCRRSCGARSGSCSTRGSTPRGGPSSRRSRTRGATRRRARP
jgi:uncharacterized protein (DUF885 family)